MSEYEEDLEYLIDYALEDWVGFSVITPTAGARTEEDATFRDEIDGILAVVADMIDHGALPGDLTEDLDGFIPWDMSKSEALKKIRAEIQTLGRMPESGEICWFHTPRPEERAQTS